MGNVESDYYDQDFSRDKNEKTKYLAIKTITSGKESYDLFNYHATDSVNKGFTIKSPK
jgi:hypothetical protein